MDYTNNIIEDLGTLYHPRSALVFYHAQDNSDMNVEHYDMDKNGMPTNAHPLSVREANRLAKALRTEAAKGSAFLKPSGIMPTNVLHINPNGSNGTLIWYTRASLRQLFFVEGLGIPNGTAQVPPMVWRADRSSLSVFALGSSRRPAIATPLYYAPFFNLYQNGNVCMGTVDIAIKKSASVEDFTAAWENYFFNSYFSHLIGGHNPVTGNCATIWKKLLQTGEAFPKEAMIKTTMTLQNLLI